MAVTAGSTPSISIAYTLTDVQTDRTISESATVGYTTQTYANGTGYNEVNMGVALTGVIASGSGYTIDLTGVPKSIFDDNVYLNFTNSVENDPSYGQGIKGILVTNTYNGPSGTGYDDFPRANLPYITVAATGAHGFSGLFGGGSGGFKVYPQSTWSYTSSALGETPYYNSAGSAHRKEIALIDSGSGVGFEAIIVGVTGAIDSS